VRASTRIKAPAIAGVTRDEGRSMSHAIAALRERHALITERITNLNSSPSTPADVTGHHHDGAPPASPSASARNLWEAKIVQLHYEAFLDGVELYPLDADGCCTTCGVHVLAIQNMRQDELAHHPS
jgi:hypothetical protein